MHLARSASSTEIERRRQKMMVQGKSREERVAAWRERKLERYLMIQQKQQHRGFDHVLGLSSTHA
jgi:hypothetical protein